MRANRLILALAAVLLWHPALAADKTWTDPVTGMVYDWVPGGSFVMGCRAQHCPESQLPAQTRSVPGFWLSRTLITRSQWAKVMAQDPSVAKKAGDFPVDQVHWLDLTELLKRLNASGHGLYRLPTETEWEYACHGGRPDTLYCGGDDPGKVAWYIMNSSRGSHAVATRAANGFGLYDMSGNLWQWTADCWSETLPKQTGAQAYKDPACEAHVLKGGSWGAYPSQLWASARRADTDVKCPYIGLRLARTSVP